MELKLHLYPLEGTHTTREQCSMLIVSAADICRICKNCDLHDIRMKFGAHLGHVLGRFFFV